jgi:hypothetical protein
MTYTNQTHPYFITLEFDHNSIDLIPQHQKSYLIEFNITNPNGPGGGNPISEIFFHSFSTIKSFLKNEYGNLNPLFTIEENENFDPNYD